jgi:hypothetical protein
MLLIIGIVIGLFLGLTGAGGSVFAVPLLIMLGGVSIHQAVTLSLAAVAAVTCMAVPEILIIKRFYGNQLLYWRLAAC